MKRCVCGGIYSFCKDYKNGKIKKDVYAFRCACGCDLFIKDNVIWYNLHPLDLNKI